MKRPQKVVAYIVREDRLLVFVHADDEQFDQSGLQVPAGTVRDGELPEQAVLREAFEETGLQGLRIERYLGAAEWDLRPYADAVHVRHFFRLSVEGAEVPDRWIAEERGGRRQRTDPFRAVLAASGPGARPSRRPICLARQAL